MNKRDFVSLSDFSIQELDKLISRAIALKEERGKNINHDPLRGKTGILMLQQNSTRTRLAFEAGMTQLGGHSIFLNDQDSQASRGEPLEDFAKIVIRKRVSEFKNRSKMTCCRPPRGGVRSPSRCGGRLSFLSF